MFRDILSGRGLIVGLAFFVMIVSGSCYITGTSDAPLKPSFDVETDFFIEK